MILSDFGLDRETLEINFHNMHHTHTENVKIREERQILWQGKAVWRFI